LAAAGLGLAFACSGTCADFVQPVEFWSDEALHPEAATDDTGLETPRLRISVSPGSSVDSDDFELSPVEGGGFRLPRTGELWGAELDADVDAVPEDFELTFELLADWATPDRYPPLTVQGGPSEADLWDGWTVLLSWGEPEDWCK
jgi:hypothetical protein